MTTPLRYYISSRSDLVIMLFCTVFSVLDTTRQTSFVSYDNIGWFKKSCDSEYSFVGNSSGLIACIPSIQPLNYKKQKTNIGKRENKRHSLKCIRIMREMSHRVSKK